MHVSAANSHLDLVGFVDLHVNPLMTELVNALRLTKEQDVHLLPLRVLVYEVRQGIVDFIVLLRYVDRLVLFNQF